MGFIAKDSGGGDFKQVPAGNYVARCYSLVDLGTHTQDGQFGKTTNHKIKISWEILDVDENEQPLTILIDGKDVPLTISKSYTLSLHEKASLRKDLASWRGRDFSEEEAKAFDVSKLVGAYAMVNVSQDVTNGKTYANVKGLSPLHNSIKNNKPVGYHENVMFDLDAPDMKVFNTFHEKLQTYIKESPEWAKSQGVEHFENHEAEDDPFQ